MKAERLLEEIKSKTDIVEFISDFVNLKKAGQNYKGLCPFHPEKTPSFMVSQVKQIFHCFGCGTGGDVVTFLMKHENLPFTEALHYLAKKTGIRVQEFSFSKDNASGKRDHILRINEAAMKFFSKNLSQNAKALDYIAKRGLTGASVPEFNIGYSGDSRDSLFCFLKKSGYSESLMLEAGLVAADRQSDRQGYRDIFRQRIIFPILNLRNDIVAFGGRVMDSSMPKYLNSPETPVFKKSDNLFGINLAKDDIRKKDYAVIVEGYLDVIICRQHGICNVIAPLGTALTSRHLQKLKVLTRNLVLVFDGDEAGLSAARRSLNVIYENDFRARIMTLPGGEDPDSFLRKNSEQSFIKRIAGASSSLEFLMKTSKKSRTETVREAIALIALLKDLILADELLSELAGRSGVHENLLRSETNKIRNKKSIQNPAQQSVHAGRQIIREEQLLLSAAISAPETAPYILSKLNVEDLRDPTVRSLFVKIIEMGKGYNTEELLDKADDPEKVVITELLMNPGFDAQHIDENINDCLRRIEQRRFEEKRIKALSKEPDDIALHNLLLKEKRKLIRGVHT